MRGNSGKDEVETHPYISLDYAYLAHLYILDLLVLSMTHFNL